MTSYTKEVTEYSTKTLAPSTKTECKQQLWNTDNGMLIYLPVETETYTKPITVVKTKTLAPSTYTSKDTFLFNLYEEL